MFLISFKELHVFLNGGKKDMHFVLTNCNVFIEISISVPADKVG
jgi:hypothetical protein